LQMSRAVVSKLAAAGVVLGLCVAGAVAAVPDRTVAVRLDGAAKPGAPVMVQRKGGGWDANGPLLNGSTGPAIGDLVLAPEV
jgi:hypothetical protein